MANLEAIASRIASEQDTLSHSGRVVRTAGTVEFKKDTGPVRRDVRVHGFKWSPDALRDLAKILWASQRAHSYAMAALRVFSKMPSSEFSPDGLLGGRGYIQSIKDLRTSLSNTVEVLSAFTDTVHDEVNADHWSGVSDQAEIDGMVADVDSVKQNPEKFVENEFQEEPLVNPQANNPEIEEEEEEEEDGENEPPHLSSDMTDSFDKYAPAFDRALRPRTASLPHTAGGTLDELPFRGPEPNIVDWDMPGPRAYKLGPGDNQDVEQHQILDVPGAQDPLVEQELLLDNGLFLPFDMNPTDADDYRLSAIDGYSMLPGADNRRNMNWYDRNLTESDIKWMEEHSDPPFPVEKEPRNELMWDEVRAP